MFTELHRWLCHCSIFCLRGFGGHNCCLAMNGIENSSFWEIQVARISLNLSRCFSYSTNGFRPEHDLHSFSIMYDFETWAVCPLLSVSAGSVLKLVVSLE